MVSSHIDNPHVFDNNNRGWGAGRKARIEKDKEEKLNQRPRGCISIQSDLDSDSTEKQLVNLQFPFRYSTGQTITLSLMPTAKL